jgi:hypothetical protein
MTLESVSPLSSGWRDERTRPSKGCKFTNWRTALMQFVARVVSRGRNSKRCAPTIGGNTPSWSASGSQRRLESMVNEPANSIVVETGDKIGPINSEVPSGEDGNCALLVWQLRSQVCRWPLWDSWEKIPPVDKRYYCGARCSSTYCFEHATAARRLVRTSAQLDPSRRLRPH